MRGRKAIRRYWQQGASGAREDVSFRHTVWAMAGDHCFAHWQASFTRIRDGSGVRLDGVFRLQCRHGDGTVLCISLQEWWHRREAPAAPEDT